MTRPIDLSGLRFGRLECAMGGRRIIHGQPTKWLCKCDCGTEKLVTASDLKKGDINSCGCLRSELISKKFKKHGMGTTPFYSCWSAMVRRCTKATDRAYKHYGGRGITVCERWKSFDNFREDMFPSYASGLTIERNNNELGYDKENCRWIPKREQGKNRRGVVILDSPWGQMTIPDAAKRVGICKVAMWRRVKQGWSTDRLYVR